MKIKQYKGLKAVKQVQKISDAQVMQELENIRRQRTRDIPVTDRPAQNGDEVIIDIWGNNQATIRQTISPDGFINVPNLGLVSLNGMTVKSADSYLRKKFGKIYPVDGENPESDIKLTLGNIRSIQVNILGEVAVPGTYSLSSLMSSS